MGKALGISLEEARQIIAAAIKKANEINVKMNIAVVDEGANLVAFERMDGAWIGSIDIAQKKAFTARAFDLDTKSLGENSQSGQQFFGIHVFKQRQDHDLCRRHSDQAWRTGRRCHRRQRKFWQRRPCRGRGRRSRSQALTRPGIVSFGYCIRETCVPIAALAAPP